ncbi:MAG TPA: sigma 54-interacting transcriptional regulator [Polyangiaceae bacterium]
MKPLELPSRYEPLACLGQGGGGQVWAVKDRLNGDRYALKVLSDGATENEMAALVREAVALSGLEGLGVPRVVRFGRLPRDGRPFMVRELVEGESLEALMERPDRSEDVLHAIARAADQLTVLHRTGLLHGDVKPANVIVQDRRRATMVDLGLAAPWLEGGARPQGLTPRYAAPELFMGRPLTVRAEVYALGVMLGEALEAASHTIDAARREALLDVARRATSKDPDERYPSADEFASALRSAARFAAEERAATDGAGWPIVGIDAVSSDLSRSVLGLGAGQLLRIDGPPGSGRSALLRRIAWSLEMAGRAVAWLDASMVSLPSAVRGELEATPAPDVVVLVDDASALLPESARELSALRGKGARLVTVGGTALGTVDVTFEVPPLDARAAIDLVRRAVPSLTERLSKRLVSAAEARPGELRRLVQLIAKRPVASERDIEALLGVASVPPPSGDPLEEVTQLLDQGRFGDAGAALERLTPEIIAERPLQVSVARARLLLNQGEAPAALRVLREQTPSDDAPEAARFGWTLALARAHLGAGDYAKTAELAAPLRDAPGTFRCEALTSYGLALSFQGRHDEAGKVLEQAVAAAQSLGLPRLEAVALGSLALAQQRADRLEDAKARYEQGLEAAERAGDAGNLATLRLNLASLLKVSGDIAAAIEHYEAAVDMGRRSGRRAAERQALLNLANADLYLGRLARARASIEALEEQRGELSPMERAQLNGLAADLYARQGRIEQATVAYEACAVAFEALGRTLDAAESRLESILVAVRDPKAQVLELRRQLRRAADELGSAPAHRPLLLLAEARVAALAGDEQTARERLERALDAAREAQQKEWIWRALESRAELADAAGQSLHARRDREEALALLEEIGARLPRDLREVYWNDPRRRGLRARVESGVAAAPTERYDADPLRLDAGTRGRTSVSTLSATPLEQRLARILEINSELAGEVDVERLTTRVTDHAVQLLRAERGYVLLCEPNGELTVHTSRSLAGDAQHHEFSRSIAQRVVETREPFMSMSARDDARIAGYSSVHQLMLESVACVPILAPSGAAIGALYLETRLRPGVHFERELSTLRAFADQVAIAFENGRLIRENRARASELERANVDLAEAQEHLRELLGDRTRKLKQARRKLRAAHERLYAHFGYQGLVGTSDGMRRVYSLIDRVKDTDVPVLITGESGTGKEMVAHAVHAASSRASAKFLGINCGAVPEQLLESELFGHVRGAFTGADRDRKGLFRECEGGTILLDEIGETPAKMQATLLRVLQERKVRPVGGNQEEDVDARVLFATNKDLAELVSRGTFREDLYYRIVVVEVPLPPLRERADDIPQLVDHFLGLFAARYKREKRAVSREAMRLLATQTWPGNVRQLENVLLNAWILSEEAELLPEDFDLPSSHGAAPAARAERTSAVARQRRGTISEHHHDERSRILEALEASNWNRVKAAELSGIPRRTFYRRLREYGIQ